MTVMLEVRNLHAFYGKSHILRGVDLRVGRGEIVAVLGRNGAGRTTLVRSLMGMVEAQGSVLFNGDEMLGRKTFEIARQGIGYVPESREIFPTLTVEQNLLLGEKYGRRSRWTMADMYTMFPQLRERRRTAGGLLSGGEQQMLALCRTLMGDPDLILIDEPTEGLAPMIISQVARYLTELAKRGVSVLLVEQKLTIALAISQRVYVMGHGSIVFEGTPEDFRDAADIRREWLQA